jgi:non-homologous end joining protein Ku
MVAPRAVWKDYLKLESITCAVKLVGATQRIQQASCQDAESQKQAAGQIRVP